MRSVNVQLTKQRSSALRSTAERFLLFDAIAKGRYLRKSPGPSSRKSSCNATRADTFPKEGPWCPLVRTPANRKENAEFINYTFVLLFFWKLTSEENGLIITTYFFNKRGLILVASVFFNGREKIANPGCIPCESVGRRGSGGIVPREILKLRFSKLRFLAFWASRID